MTFNEIANWGSLSLYDMVIQCQALKFKEGQTTIRDECSGVQLLLIHNWKCETSYLTIRRRYSLFPY